MIHFIKVRSLPPELHEWRQTIEAIAREEGLDFFEVVFEMITYEKMSEIAAYGGFPTRYPHWRWGMEYDHLSKSHTYGLSKIYELVINTDPCYAYLLEGNALVDQKLVMAHVFGHADFFKNNFWFSRTDRKMVDTMANNATRVRRYQDLYGVTTVEEFIDVCLSLENLIDRHQPYIEQKRPAEKKRKEDLPDELLGDGVDLPRLQAKEYMDEFVNPESFMEAQRQKKKAELARRRFPERPQRDVLLFLMQEAPLTRWQRNVLGIVRDEAYYFAPQAMTKIMNEGWASFWHTHIMTRRGVMDPSEVIDYADRHSRATVMSKGNINPYKIGIELFRYIEWRWDTGRFGKAWDECDDLDARAAWDRPTGLGRQKVFEVRRHHNDVTFLDEFLTPEFCAQQKLFTFGHNPRANEWQIASREFAEIKKKLLFQLTNMGQPLIEVEDANFENRSELLLAHRHEGVDLDDKYAVATLRNLFALWKRPVHIASRKGERGVLLSYDGKQPTERAFDKV
ncbi:MAG: SpoVR family protein [Myxococcales bacterium]|nr:SpoVR family protein [Myxococcales bacterium]